MILLLDNYDSFVYNLDRYLQRLGQDTVVIRSDAIAVEAIAKLEPHAIVISPGPKSPNEAGCSVEVVRRLGRSIPTLGVCLGHQAIGHAFGGRIIRGSKPVHGKQSLILHNQSGIFEGIPSPLHVARYHSLIIDDENLPDCLEVLATTSDQVIMAIRHRLYPIFGVQFHPESILTECGYDILANFLRLHGLSYKSIPASDFNASSYQSNSL
jgi:anthranilate synthase component 2